jgi:HAMP domain-containing protein
MTSLNSDLEILRLQHRAMVIAFKMASIAQKACQPITQLWVSQQLQRSERFVRDYWNTDLEHAITKPRTGRPLILNSRDKKLVVTSIIGKKR